MNMRLGYVFLFVNLPQTDAKFKTLELAYLKLKETHFQFSWVTHHCGILNNGVICLMKVMVQYITE